MVSLNFFYKFFVYCWTILLKNCRSRPNNFGFGSSPKSSALLKIFFEWLIVSKKSKIPNCLRMSPLSSIANFFICTVNNNLGTIVFPLALKRNKILQKFYFGLHIKRYFCGIIFTKIWESWFFAVVKASTANVGDKIRKA